MIQLIQPIAIVPNGNLITMTDDHPDIETLQSQRKALIPFSLLITPPDLSPTEQTTIQQTLKCFDQVADYETLGVCADDLASAKGAMEAYLKAFGISVSLDIPTRTGSVYLKFNTLNGQWYLDDYTGPSRGMLVTFHASDVEEISGTYGPFPLGLFD